MRLRRLLAGLLLLGLLGPGSALAGTGGKRKSAAKTKQLDKAKRRPPALALAPRRLAEADPGAASHPAKKRESAQKRETSKSSRSEKSAKVVKPEKAGKTGKTSKTGKRRGKAAPEPDRFPPFRIESVNTGEKANLKLYDRKGRTQKGAVRSLWSLMRCHLTGKQRPIHWRLIRNLYKISRHYGGKTIYLYSGYRAKRVASLRSSNHIKGRAADIRVAGVSNRALRDYLMASYKPCGVGYYPNGLFVHFDVREKQSAFWVDYSGKGESAEYASDPYAVIRGEKTADKAGKAKPKKAEKTGRPAKEPASVSPAAGADEPAEAETGSKTAPADDEAAEEPKRAAGKPRRAKPTPAEPADDAEAPAAPPAPAKKSKPTKAKPAPAPAEESEAPTKPAAPSQPDEDDGLAGAPRGHKDAPP